MRGAWWSRMAELPLAVEGYELDRLAADASFGFERVTTHIRLLGGGADGLGEDVSPFPEEHDAQLRAGPSLPLAGDWTLGGFCDHLATLDQWPAPPAWEAARGYRNWAFESAALDLALRQDGRALSDLLGLEARPVRFVNSLGLGDPPSIATIQRARPLSRAALQARRRPGLDAGAHGRAGGHGRGRHRRLQGRHYGQAVEDVPALVALYERVLATFPGVLVEDPHDLPEVAERLAPQLERVSYDAPIHAVGDLDTTPLAARIVNVKPSRIGRLATLLDLYAHGERYGLRMYGGGMGEVGVGRGQVQLLASLFHADEPNDVAPSAFNAADPPDGLPSSPLVPSPEPAGFRWAG